MSQGRYDNGDSSLKMIVDSFLFIFKAAYIKIKELFSI